MTEYQYINGYIEKACTIYKNGHNKMRMNIYKATEVDEISKYNTNKQTSHKRVRYIQRLGNSGRFDFNV